LLLLLSAQDLAACALLFATVAVTASDQFLSFDYIEPMSGTLGEPSRLASPGEPWAIAPQRSSWNFSPKIKVRRRAQMFLFAFSSLRHSST
jgi:hypothetical protein